MQGFARPREKAEYVANADRSARWDADKGVADSSKIRGDKREQIREARADLQTAQSLSSRSQSHERNEVDPEQVQIRSF
jgi:hypothetical protein